MMDRKSISKLLRDILKYNKLLDIGVLYAEEVTIDAFLKNSMRIDVMEFKSGGATYVSDIENGIFTCYEIKSCKADVYSGNGLNFIGDENYLVTTMQTYKDILPDINSGKLQKYIKDNHKESSANFGVMIPVPINIDLRCSDKVFDEFTNPTEFVGEYTDWKLYKIIPCRTSKRKRSMAELLFCMLRSKHNN